MRERRQSFCWPWARTIKSIEAHEGEGKEESNRLRGEVEAEIITSYAKAIEQAGEFYTFVRTLEAYKKALGNDTRLILTTDSEFFRLLKEIGKAEPVSPRPESALAKRRRFRASPNEPFIVKMTLGPPDLATLH